MASFFALALAGCGGGDGGSSSGTTTSGSSGSSASVPAAIVPTGTAPVTLTTSTPAATLAALAPSVTVGSVSINSPPTVTFSIADASGNGIIGLGYTKQTATQSLPQLANLSFSLAKLVPGTNGSPSQWVSYIVKRAPSKNATTGVVNAATPSAPTTDVEGTLVDNKNGTYSYTFYVDVTKIKDEVAAMTPASGASLADLGDLTYDPKLTHRLTIQISGNVWGTSTQTANGADSGVAAMPMKNPVNIVYDFIPATGQAVTASDTSRDIVATAKCQECHSKLGGIPGSTKLIDSQDLKTRVPASEGFHGGGRYETKYCMVCHTDQRKYNQPNLVSTNFAYPAYTRTVTAPTGTSTTYRESYSYKNAAGTTITGSAVHDGVTVADFPVFIHKLHMGERLVKTNYNFGGVLFNEVKFPQPITNCVKCHDGSSTSTAKTANGDNYKLVPSRKACGACHDGVDFAKNTGVTLADHEDGKTSSSPAHIGGVKTDDTQCAICHTSADIPVYHLTVDPKLSSANSRAWYTPVGSTTAVAPAAASQLGNLPSDVHKVNFEIKQVKVASNKATVVYRILIDGKAATMNATGFLFDQIDGTPSIYVAYATAQDGIAAPADWNGSINATVKALRDGKLQTGPDADGYYTATLSSSLPADAKLVTGAIGINYGGLIQLDAAGYKNGILLREPKFVMKTADGYSARRQVVDGNKCNNCHGQLGITPTFHGGARNNGEGCAMCHQPNTATGHVGPSNDFGGGWSVAIKNLVHGIHASSKRTQDFTYEASSTNLRGFNDVTYPGVLKNCEQCHVAGAYDYSGTTVKAALDAKSLLWFTDAKGDMTNNSTTNPTGKASIGLSPWVTTNGKGQISYTADNLVSSPIASSCFGCHDSTDAVAHMENNGGTLVRLWSSVASVATRPAVGATSTNTFTKTEQCMFCHSSTSTFGLGIKAVHAN